MSTAAVSTSSIYQELQAYFQHRGLDLQKLGQALKSGDLAAAQQQYQAIQELGQSGPFAKGDPFKIARREQDFQALGQALQSGDLQGAKKAFGKLVSSLRHGRNNPAPAQVAVNGGDVPAGADSSPSTANNEKLSVALNVLA